VKIKYLDCRSAVDYYTAVPPAPRTPMPAAGNAPKLPGDRKPQGRSPRSPTPSPISAIWGWPELTHESPIFANHSRRLT